MPRTVTFDASTPLKVDPNLEPGQTPPAPNVIPWPRDEQGKLKVLSLCTCGISAKFPFCDGAHKTCKAEDPTLLYAYDIATRTVTRADPLPGSTNSP
jgi:Iron-binding zinc finger CDGSH type